MRYEMKWIAGILVACIIFLWFIWLRRPEKFPTPVISVNLQMLDGGKNHASIAYDAAKLKDDIENAVIIRDQAKLIDVFERERSKYVEIITALISLFVVITIYQTLSNMADKKELKELSNLISKSSQDSDEKINQVLERADGNIKEVRAKLGTEIADFKEESQKLHAKHTADYKHFEMMFMDVKTRFESVQEQQTEYYNKLRSNGILDDLERDSRALMEGMEFCDQAGRAMPNASALLEYIEFIYEGRISSASRLPDFAGLYGTAWLGRSNNLCKAFGTYIQNRFASDGANPDSYASTLFEFISERIQFYFSDHYESLEKTQVTLTSGERPFPPRGEVEVLNLGGA